MKYGMKVVAFRNSRMKALYGSYSTGGATIARTSETIMITTTPTMDQPSHARRGLTAGRTPCR
jgi:hypothetical protein